MFKAWEHNEPLFIEIAIECSNKFEYLKNLIFVVSRSKILKYGL